MCRLPITELPESFSSLTSLKTLLMVSCCEIQQLPANFDRLGALKSLCMVKQPILKLPVGLGGMAAIQRIYEGEVFNRLQLPGSPTGLTSLTQLDLDFISEEKLPEGIGKLNQLRQLHIQCCFDLKEIPDSVTGLTNLDTLTIGLCSQLVSLPNKLDGLFKLKRLEIIGCHPAVWLNGPRISLPSSLDSLSLGSYNHAMHLLDLPVLPNLKKLTLNVVNVEGGEGGVAVHSAFPQLEHLELVLAEDAEELTFPLASLPQLRILAISRAGNIEKLPGSIGSDLKHLRHLRIENAPELQVLPETVTQLRHLTSLGVHAPKLTSLPTSIGALSRLRELDLSDCSALENLPASLTQLACLNKLSVQNTAIRSFPANFAQLTRLKSLDLYGCARLESLPEDFPELGMLQFFRRLAPSPLPLGSTWCFSQGGSNPPSLPACCTEHSPFTTFSLYHILPLPHSPFTTFSLYHILPLPHSPFTTFSLLSASHVFPHIAHILPGDFHRHASLCGVNLVAFSGGVDSSTPTTHPPPLLPSLCASHPTLSQETRSLSSPSGVNLVAFSGGVDSSLAAHLLHRAFSDSLSCSPCLQHPPSQETRSLSSPSVVNLVAFSGGVDSSLAAFLLHRARSDLPTIKPLAHFAINPHPPRKPVRSPLPPGSTCPSLSSSQLTTARHVAAAIGIPLWEVETTEGQVPEYVANEGASCYACKATLYTTLYTVAQQSLTRIGMDSSNRNEVTLFNGTNADDLSDPSRLGLLAALHCRVVSPLARLPKAAVRAVARAAGLPNWDLAASPCLRSRLAFGVEATASTLMLVERAEKMVRSFLPLTQRDNTRVRLLHPTFALFLSQSH
ncbi:unnamed protein product [Closterium sp. NIES-64]|nr:unnamed protein product [Closterium sp. NIES-64]